MRFLRAIARTPACRTNKIFRASLVVDFLLSAKPVVTRTVPVGKAPEWLSAHSTHALCLPVIYPVVCAERAGVAILKAPDV